MTKNKKVSKQMLSIAQPNRGSIGFQESLLQQKYITYAGNGTTGFLEGERPTGSFMKIPPQPQKG